MRPASVREQTRNGELKLSEKDARALRRVLPKDSLARAKSLLQAPRGPPVERRGSAPGVLTDAGKTSESSGRYTHSSGAQQDPTVRSASAEPCMEWSPRTQRCMKRVLPKVGYQVIRRAHLRHRPLHRARVCGQWI
jgi:hypothetical protein